MATNLFAFAQNMTENNYCCTVFLSRPGGIMTCRRCQLDCDTLHCASPYGLAFEDKIWYIMCAPCHTICSAFIIEHAYKTFYQSLIALGIIPNDPDAVYLFHRSGRKAPTLSKCVKPLTITLGSNDIHVNAFFYADGEAASKTIPLHVFIDDNDLKVDPEILATLIQQWQEVKLASTLSRLYDAKNGYKDAKDINIIIEDVIERSRKLLGKTSNIDHLDILET